MRSMALIFMQLGVFLFGLGVVLYVTNRFFAWGHLPGDFFWQKGNVTFYFPLATSLILSLALTLLFSFFRR